MMKTKKLLSVLVVMNMMFGLTALFGGITGIAADASGPVF